MQEISNSELVLLSLIREKPRHAYEIEQVIEERNIRDWTAIGFSSIYRVLTQLEQSGLLDGQMQPPEGRGPARKVYHLTRRGDEAWLQASLEALAHPKRTYSPFLVGLDNLCVLPHDQAVQAITTYLNDQQHIYNGLSAAVKHHPLKGDFYIQVFFDYLLTQLKAEISWLRALLTKLDDHHQSSKE